MRRSGTAGAVAATDEEEKKIATAASTVSSPRFHERGSLLLLAPLERTVLTFQSRSCAVAAAEHCAEDKQEHHGDAEWPTLLRRERLVVRVRLHHLG